MPTPWRTSMMLILSVSTLLQGATPGELKKIKSIMRTISRSDSEEARGALLGELSGVVKSPRLKRDYQIVCKQNREWLDLRAWQETTDEEVDPEEGWKVPTGPCSLGIAPASPFYDLASFYEARNLTWYAMEGLDDTAVDTQCMTRARRLFKHLAVAWPQNKLVKTYLYRDPVVPIEDTESPASAPEWARLQRKSLEGLTRVIEWWVDHRQGSDMDYGGGWGDDCEMWRWWVPVLVGFNNPKVEEAQKNFSEALLKKPYLADGYYSKKLTDVEHSAEDLSDALTPMMHLSPKDPRWEGKAKRLIELMRTRWTGRNQKGLLQFKSTYFTVDDMILDDATKTCDTVYHPRAIQPALLHWQRTGDPDTGQLVLDWVRTWVEAARSTEKGKPAGVIPSAIHWEDGLPGGSGPDWWNPKNYPDDYLYGWPSAMDYMLDVMLLCYQASGNETYLEPIRSMADIRREFLNRKSSEEPVPGSREWCGKQMDFLGNTLGKYSLLTGTRDYDDILEDEGMTYALYRLAGGSGATEELLPPLAATVQSLQRYFPCFTSEVRYTDRVLYFPRIFDADPIILESPVKKVPRPYPTALYSMVTGDPGSLGYFPMNAVRWHTPSKDLAALVTQASGSTFSAQLYHFGPSPRSFSMEMFQLKPGTYDLTVDGVTHPLTVTAPAPMVPVTLPSQRLVTITIAPHP